MRVILSEKQLKECIKATLMEDLNSKKYSIDPNQVLIVKRFLDDGFIRLEDNVIGPDGFPCNKHMVGITDKNGVVFENSPMTIEDLVDLLLYKFPNMFLDKIQSNKFFTCVANEWFNNTITPEGFLSVNFLNEMTSKEIDERANEANVTPTEAQKKASNYKMGHVYVKGMKIAIENPKGSYRIYKNENGDEGKNLMHHHYGYFNCTLGKDGDAVDCFLGPDIENFDKVYCIDQNDKEGNFDETKVMLGFNSKKEAKAAYLSNYSPNWKGFRDITCVSLKFFKKWLYRGRKQRLPFGEYVNVIKNKIKAEK